jgi:hypothetical protein
MMFWAMTVIHSTCRFQSGSTAEVTGGGGASSDVVKAEYVTISERRIDKRAGRRSCDEKYMHQHQRSQIVYK